jgi:hypothetical protein
MLLALAPWPHIAEAHDDPVVTVRVMADGFNSVNMDAVLGELSDSATLKVDRTVQGADQVRAWVREQMDSDLRIEITDIGTPERLPDGYTLNWTARFSRHDWRLQGITARVASNRVVIHNGRITDWTAALQAADSSSPEAAPAAGTIVANDPNVPEISGVPVTLLIGLVVVASGLFAAGYRFLRPRGN